MAEFRKSVPIVFPAKCSPHEAIKVIMDGVESLGKGFLDEDITVHIRSYEKSLVIGEREETKEERGDRLDSWITDLTWDINDLVEAIDRSERRQKADKEKASELTKELEEVKREKGAL